MISHCMILSKKLNFLLATFALEQGGKREIERERKRERQEREERER